jgi:hypothetical protein
MDPASVLERSARHFARRPAVVDGDRVLDFATLDRR